MTGPRPHVVRRGAGLPLLFVHGNAVDHRLLIELDDVFCHNGGWERIYFDLPGFGQTPALDDPGGLPELADWLDEAVGSLVGGLPFAIVGSSLGGLLARDLVSRRPGQCVGMALLATVVDPVHANRALPDPVIAVEDHGLLASLDADDAAMYREVAVVRSSANWERFRRAALPGLRLADTDAMARLAARYTLPDFEEERLDGFDRPVLIVAGRQDAVVGFEDQSALARRFTTSSLAVLDHAGHNVHLDQPTVVRALLEDWAARVVRYVAQTDARDDPTGAISPGRADVILYVADQQASAAFYRALLGRAPVLDVPGMTEFLLADRCKLGLMPAAGIARLLGDAVPHPDTGAGIPRCELYLQTPDARASFERAIAAGAHPVSAPKARDWGDVVGYVADPDGHVLAFAQPLDDA